jgi:hypothetical protein
MSDIAITPSQQQPAPPRNEGLPDPAVFKGTTPSSPPETTQNVDTVRISLSTQTTAAQNSGATLSETDAANQSVALRQNLPKLNLSGTAKQNQAILSLLR